MAEANDALSLAQRAAGKFTGISSAPNAKNSQLTSLSPSQRSASSLKLKQSKLLPEYTCFIDCADLNIHFKAALPPDFDWNTEAHYDSPFKDVVSDAVSNMGAVGGAASGMARASGISMVTQALTAKFWTGSSSGTITLPLILQAENDELEEVIKPMLDLTSLTLPRLAGNKAGSLLESPGPYLDLLGTTTEVVNDAKAPVTKVAGQVTSVASKASSVGSYGEVVGKLQASAKEALDKFSADDVSGALHSTRKGVEVAGQYVDNLVKNNIRNRIELRIGKYMVFNNVVITSVSQKHVVQVVGRGYGVGSDATHGGNMQRVELSVTFEPFFDLTQQDLLTMFVDPRAKAYVETLLARGIRK